MKKKMKALKGLAIIMDRLWKGAAGLVTGKTGNQEEPLYNNLFNTSMIHKIEIEIRRISHVKGAI
jgi:hypothetical protein